MAIKLKEAFKLFDKSDKSMSKLDAIYDKIENMVQPDTKYTLYLCDEKENRSLAANRYYWGVVLKTIFDHTGIESEDMHEVLKSKFNPKKLSVGIESEEIEIGATTKSLSTEDFIRYIEKVRLWALESLECYIPLPQETEKAEFQDLYIEATHMKI